MKPWAALLFLLASLLPAPAPTLEWNAPANATGIVGYRLYYGTISQAQAQSVDSGLALFASVPDDSVPFGGTLFFVARSYNAAGQESANSNEVSWTRAMPTPTPVPSPPENLRIRLSVVNGRGDGLYRVGEIVRVRADKPPKAMAFRGWIGDWVILANPELSMTTATIPSMDVLIQATYGPQS
jgi:hypothetical protein